MSAITATTANTTTTTSSTAGPIEACVDLDVNFLLLFSARL
jgi:hypothetical protein